MVEFKELAVKTVVDAYYSYFVNKDAEVMLKKCVDRSAVIGVVRPVWESELIITSEQNCFEKYSEELALVNVKLCLRDKTRKMKDDCHINGTFLCKRENENIQFLSIHLSNDQELIIEESEAEYSDEFSSRALRYMYDVVFEYDDFKKTFTYDYEKNRKLFELNRHFVSMDQWFWCMCTECLHPEDAELLDIFRNNDIGKRIKTDDCVVENYIRIKNSKEGYIWVKMVVIFIPNKARNNVDKVYVLFKNVNEKRKREFGYMHRARVDYLTDLFNKEYVDEKVDEYLKNNIKMQGAYAILDVNEFKKINDIYGHIAGNDILVKISKKIGGYANEDTFVGRIGGDEFCIFFKKESNLEEAKEKVANITKEMEFDYSEDDIVTKVTCNAGVAIYSIENTNADELYKAAIRDLEAVKKKIEQ